MKPDYARDGIELYCGDCLEVLGSLPAESIHAVVTDPPYPEIDRDYGRMTEYEWHQMMGKLIETMHGYKDSKLTSSGSAVFILQPNSESVGTMRPWLWEFIAKWAKRWNLVQDAYWWNFAAPPTVHCHEKNGLMRPSLKYCVWFGAPDCFRSQDAVLLQAAEATLSDKRINRHDLGYSPSGLSMRHGRALSRCIERGGATPFNVIVCGNSDAFNSAGAAGHGAGTPYHLTEWWVRYISPVNGVVCDPFCGTGMTAIACIRNNRRFIGCEKYKPHFERAVARIEAEFDRHPLFETLEPENQSELFPASFTE